MDIKHIEITKIDPKRWVLLHVPLGIVLGLWFSVWAFFLDWGTGAELWIERGIAIFVIAPCVVFTFLAFVWLQVQFLNLAIRMVRRGPVLEVQSVEQRHHGEFKRHA